MVEKKGASKPQRSGLGYSWCGTPTADGTWGAGHGEGACFLTPEPHDRLPSIPTSRAPSRVHPPAYGGCSTTAFWGPPSPAPVPPPQLGRRRTPTGRKPCLPACLLACLPACLPLCCVCVARVGLLDGCLLCLGEVKVERTCLRIGGFSLFFFLGGGGGDRRGGMERGREDEIPEQGRGKRGREDLTWWVGEFVGRRAFFLFLYTSFFLSLLFPRNCMPVLLCSALPLHYLCLVSPRHAMPRHAMLCSALLSP
jgi:hypothetical protein